MIKQVSTQGMCLKSEISKTKTAPWAPGSISTVIFTV